MRYRLQNDTECIWKMLATQDFPFLLRFEQLHGQDFIYIFLADSNRIAFRTFPTSGKVITAICTQHERLKTKRLIKFTGGVETGY